MLTPLLGRDIFFNPVREEHHPDLIVILDGTEGNRGSNLGHHVTFHLFLCTKIQRSTDIDEQHHRHLTLFLEDLHVWTVETRCHIPVDVTHIIAELILTHLAKSHTPTLEGRMVLTCKDV